MPTYLGEFANAHGTVKRYRADTTFEEQQEIIKGVLTVCAKAKAKKRQTSERNQK